MNATPFLSARRKVHQAERHYADMLDAISTYESTDPASAEYVEREDGVKVQFSVREPVPDEISLMFGDFLHNLRSALDHVVFAAGGSTDITTTLWPMGTGDGKKPDKWGQQVRSACPAKTPAGRVVRQYARDAEPWIGGKGEWMWALHRLDIIDKHRLVLAATIVADKVRMQIRMDGISISEATPDSSQFVPGLARLDLTYEPPPGPIEDGGAINVIPHEEFERLEGLTLAFDVGMNEPSVAPLHGRSLIKVASSLRDNVQNLIQEVEALVVGAHSAEH